MLSKCADIRKERCFACTKGKCIALSNTYFKDGICKFFKDKDIAKQERLERDGYDMYDYFVKEGVYIDEGKH